MLSWFMYLLNEGLDIFCLYHWLLKVNLWKAKVMSVYVVFNSMRIRHIGWFAGKNKIRMGLSSLLSYLIPVRFKGKIDIFLRKYLISYTRHHYKSVSGYNWSPDFLCTNHGLLGPKIKLERRASLAQNNSGSCIN